VRIGRPPGREADARSTAASAGCRALAKCLAHYAARYADRDRATAEAYRSGAYSMQAIAEYFGVSRMTVSRAVKRHEDAAAEPDVTCET